VEGQTLTDLRQNPLKDRVSVIQDIHGWNSYRLDAGGFQPPIARSVPLRPIPT
jgi:hypothetical protein